MMSDPIQTGGAAAGTRAGGAPGARADGATGTALGRAAAAAGDGVLRPEEMVGRAEEAAALLKALAHDGRLMILCHLSQGEKSVTELEMLLASRQAAVSQQLARLRAEGLVRARRDGKTIHYALSDPKAARLVALVYDMFCAQ